MLVSSFRSTWLLVTVGFASSAVASSLSLLKRHGIDPNPNNNQQVFEKACMSAAEGPTQCGLVESIGESCLDLYAVMDMDDSAKWFPVVQHEQACLCQSQFFQAWKGCMACAAVYMDPGIVRQVPERVINSFTSSYCAVTNTPAPFEYEIRGVLQLMFEDPDRQPIPTPVDSLADATPASPVRNAGQAAETAVVGKVALAGVIGLAAVVALL